MSVEVPVNNLYSTGYLIEFSEDEKALLRDKLVMEPTEEDEYHTVIEGERIDQIAYKVYSKHTLDASKYWWVIADVNGIHNPLDLSEWVGEELWIPKFKRVKLEL